MSDIIRIFVSLLFERDCFKSHSIFKVQISFNHSSKGVLVTCDFQGYCKTFLYYFVNITYFDDESNLLSSHSAGFDPFACS